MKYAMVHNDVCADHHDKEGQWKNQPHGRKRVT